MASETTVAIPPGAVRIPICAPNGTVRTHLLIDAADEAWVTQWAWRRHGCPSRYYAARTVSIDGKPHTIHLARALLGLEEGDPRGVQHLNRDALDCRRSNLLLSGRGGGGDPLTAEALAAARADWHQAPRGYPAVRAAAAVRGIPVGQLLALSPVNDPFYAGMPTQRQQAAWLAALWQRFQFPQGVHERRIHYRLVSTPDLYLPDGTPYENSEKAEAVLQAATKAARYLGLVPVEAFEDRRNPAPHLHVEPRLFSPEPTVEVAQIYRWDLPRIDTALAAQLALSRPVVTVTGYDYAEADQPYLLEVWVEKSTMNDVLLPVCRRYGANLVTSVGFQSISNSVKVIRERILPHDKPARIFYVSDFDPAGDGMPAAAARHLEWWLAEYAPDADVKLTPLALTREQARLYDLPWKPIKPSENRREAFEKRYGEGGAVELDALEALQPGLLAEIVTEALAPYRDHRLEVNLARTSNDAEQAARDAWAEEWADEADELTAIETDARAILRTYEERLQALNEELQAELAPLQERLAVLEETVDELAADFDTDLPERPEPTVTPPDESEWLFDAGRSYYEQLAYYQARKDGDGATMDADDGAA